MPTVERAHFRAMGSTAIIEVRGGCADAIAEARAMVAALERRWSRFLDTSDITRLNVADGSEVLVDRSTLTLVESLIAGFVATNGRFDPTMLAPLVALGYHASQSNLANVMLLEPRALDLGDVDAIVIDHERCVVRLPRGTMLDPGGLGKGLAADLVVEQIMQAGAIGAMVSLGGDVRVSGHGPHERAWQIDVGAPDRCAAPIGSVLLGDGGIATSGVARKSWNHPAHGTVHHLLDPATRRPLPTGGFVQATVIAGTAAWAEAYTKALMIAGTSGLEELDLGGLPACALHSDGTVHTNRAWTRFAIGEMS